MKTPRREKCEQCGTWAICVWSMDPIRRWCETCHDEWVAWDEATP